MNNILLNRLPESVEVGGRVYLVDWGYRAMMLIEICMYDKGRTDEQKMLDALNIFYQREIPPETQEALDLLMWFYRCGKSEQVRKENAAPAKSAKRIYCFDADAPYIYAAFLSQYSIDLNVTKNKELHWWKFHSLFESLDEDLKFCKIMYYRTASLSGVGKEKRRFLNEMKKLYALDSQNQNLDDKVRLAKRNADMKDYVRRRAYVVYGNAES